MGHKVKQFNFLISTSFNLQRSSKMTPKFCILSEGDINLYLKSVIPTQNKCQATKDCSTLTLS